MVCILVPAWGLSVGRADYYGWRVGAHIGKWLIFIWRLPPPVAEPRALDDWDLAPAPLPQMEANDATPTKGDRHD